MIFVDKKKYIENHQPLIILRKEDSLWNINTVLRSVYTAVYSMIIHLYIQYIFCVERSRLDQQRVLWQLSSPYLFLVLYKHFFYLVY